MSDSPQAQQILCPESGDPIRELEGFTFNGPIRVIVNEGLRDVGCTPDTMPCTAEADDMFDRYPGCPCYRYAANALDQLMSAGFVVRHESEMP